MRFESYPRTNRYKLQWRVQRQNLVRCIGSGQFRNVCQINIFLRSFFIEIIFHILGHLQTDVSAYQSKTPHQLAECLTITSAQRSRAIRRPTSNRITLITFNWIRVVRVMIRTLKMQIIPVRHHRKHSSSRCISIVIRPISMTWTVNNRQCGWAPKTVVYMCTIVRIIFELKRIKLKFNMLALCIPYCEYLYICFVRLFFLDTIIENFYLQIFRQ